MQSTSCMKEKREKKREREMKEGSEGLRKGGRTIENADSIVGKVKF